jgi:hypothetical protein
MMEEVKAGDMIKVRGITRTIKEIISQDYYGDRDGWYIEFVGTDGKYGYWKQGCDGGQLIRVTTK